MHFNYHKTKNIILVILIFFSTDCKEKFVASLPSPPTGYLVIEGFINSGQTATTIQLSRSTSLNDPSGVLYEDNAIINVLGENNETYPLYGTGNGTYTSPSSLNLNDNEKYRLQIKTADSHEYLSDFTAVKHTPDIDSVSFTRDDNGVKIYVNSHDPANNTKYYKWDYEETWEFHATYYSSLAYSYNANGAPDGVYYRNPDQSVDTTIHKCWNTIVSTNINIGSSEKLSTDVIHLPLISIEPASVRLSVLYSVLVRQYALSKNAYLFYQKIKKNTENLGSIFDAQPSELAGNIHSITDPTEIVVGYVDVSEEKQQRIFIRNSQVPGWGYATPCDELIIDNQPDSLQKNGSGLFPTVPFSLGAFGGVSQFYATPEESCMNCTLSGFNVRPSYWP